MNLSLQKFLVLPRGVFTVYENQELQVTLQRYIYRNKKKLEVKHGPCSLKSLVVRLGTTFAVVDAMYKESIKRHQGGDIKFGYYIDVSYSVYRRGNVNNCYILQIQKQIYNFFF